MEYHYYYYLHIHYLHILELDLIQIDADFIKQFQYYYNIFKFGVGRKSDSGCKIGIWVERGRNDAKQ